MIDDNQVQWLITICISTGLDLGWNDPPMFSYDSRQVYNNVKKPTLTKRVGLSWESPSPAPPGSKSDEPVIPASAPPRGPAPGPPPPSSSNRVMHSSPAVPPQPSAPPIEDEGKPDPPKLVENLASENSEINLDSVSKALSDLAETLLGDKEVRHKFPQQNSLYSHFISL